MLLCYYAGESSSRDGLSDNFMEGLETKVTRTEFFRVHPSTFKEAVGIALNGEFKIKDVR